MGLLFFFVVIYLHIGRGLYIGSYKFSVLWVRGLVLLLVLIGTAFLGYVLPWGQISFWGATVITNLVSAVPYLGASIVEWLWGGYSVRGVTLSRFFSFHFLFPFLLCALVVIHLLFLHTNGSRSSSSISVGLDKIRFGPYYIYKDLLGLFVFLFGFFLISIIFTYNLGDPENFNPANPLSTPVHIQPEWYFLFAYAILRSIPRKLGGVVALLISIIVFFFHSLVTGELTSLKLSYFKKFFFWGFVGFFFILTWIGAKPVETPYEGVGQFTGLLYFIYSFIFIVW